MTPARDLGVILRGRQVALAVLLGGTGALLLQGCGGEAPVSQTGSPVAATSTAGPGVVASKSPEMEAGPQADPSYLSSPEPDAPLYEEGFSPETSSQPGSYTQDTPQMWGIYEKAGSKRYIEDSTVRGVFPESALALGKGAGDFERVFGEVISDAETSAQRIREKHGDGPISISDIKPGEIVNRYPDSVFIVPKEVDGVLYVYAASRDRDHLITYTVRV